MDYRSYIGEELNDPILIDDEPYDKGCHYIVKESEFIRPRLGIPSGFVSWERHQQDICAVKRRFLLKGYNSGVPRNINTELRRHIEYFRNCLDVYNHMIDKKVFCRDELYYRCLDEGPAFTSFIKKSRAYSLQDVEALDEVETKDEYVHPEYSGYDSIFHERYLINWDDRDDTVDWPYSLIEPKELDKDELNEVIFRFLQTIGMNDYDEPDIVPILEPVANKKSNIGEKDTVLLKDTWHPFQEGTGTYYAQRRVVPTQPGSTRDTGVPDIETLCKLKLIHQHARRLSEVCKHSANCTFSTLNKRVKRVRNNTMFIHIDFKKFGLTFNRELPNAVLRGINKPHLQITDFILQDGEDIFQTERGGVLGWFDPLVALAIIAILGDIKKKYRWHSMDFIVFNDDVEIAFDDTDNIQKIELRKKIIIEELERYDFILSNRKIYCSRMFVFLEQYYHASDKLDMSKKQLAVQQYAKSLASPYSWEAKVYYALGQKSVKSSWLRDVCQNSIKQVFDDEYDKPVELGGWNYLKHRNLNLALEEASLEDLRFYFRILKYKEPHLMPKMKVLNLETILKRKERIISEARKGRPENYKIEFDTRLHISQDQLEAMALIAEEEDSTSQSEYDQSLDEGFDWYAPGIT